ncbi:hypothetical protein [Streptacidiphilus anmyonensis]|uniref:hypothetical protein n=1 Tax=Streptacidiphilus anmyonensis TaxID=405782 RepID=UPI00069320DB|nr:hypothetical protein [Streptacidiphilus anmyonensis]
MLLRLLDVGETALLHREDLSVGVVDAAVVHPKRQVRADAAEICRLSPSQWERLIAATREPDLRGQLVELAEERLEAGRLSRGGRGIGRAPHRDAEPPTTPDEIAAMAAQVPHIDPQNSTMALWWVGALHTDGAAMRQLAGSPKLLIRRSVARAPHLPADVVSRLARDPDRVVRLFLAESCDDAPADMLLEVAGWWEGSLWFPGRPRTHPNFPRDGLLRFEADPNPLLRALTLDDPFSTAEHAERLSSDPDPIVRRAAAADRRLASAAVARLAADPDQGVRWRAWINPGLRTSELVKLLLDPRSAESAVRNPAIPVAVMHRMITLAIPHIKPLDHLARR